MADILVVDDDVDVAESLVEFLRDEGHDVRLAMNGEQGIAMLQERHPDVVLLDVEMPILDGPGMAYQMLLLNCGLEKVPVVLLSGVVELHRVAERTGTPYFLRKPCMPDALLEMLERALTERRAPSMTLKTAREPQARYGHGS